MTHKKVDNADAGTLDKFGGNDLDKWSDFASGVDTDDYDINSDTQYRYDKFQIRNSANTFGHKHRSLATAARTVTLPDEDLTLGPIANTGPGRWIIYRTGTGSAGPYKAFNKRTATVVYSGTSLDAVLDPVLVDIEAGDQGTVTSFLSTGGHIYLDGTDTYYFCSAGFDGFNIPQYTTIEGPANARILVRSGYAGNVFRIPSWKSINPTKYTSSTLGISILGMAIDENTPRSRDWTGILLDVRDGGIYGTHVEKTRISNAHTGLAIKQFVDGEHGCTSCWFEKLYITAPKWAAVDQELFGTNPTNEFSQNMFRDIVIQCSGDFPVYGFRNMGHRRCIYENCMVWDVHPGQIKGTIDPILRSGSLISRDNTIICGILTHNPALPSSGTYPADHPLVLAGYYSAGQAHAKWWTDPTTDTTIIGMDEFNEAKIPRLIIEDSLELKAASDIILDATTGTKIGTATTQKLGFFNATPVVRPTAISSPTADVTSLKTAVDAIRTRLTSLGLTA